MIVVDVGHTLGNLRARNATIQIEHLGSNLLEHIGTALDAHKLIVKLVSSSNNLNVVKEVSIDCGKADSAIIHLASENLVAEEVVTENTAVTVWTEDAFVAGDIWQISDHSMH